MTKQSLKALRIDEQVPCVLYGGGTCSFVFGSVQRIIYTPNVYIVKVMVDGKDYSCVMQDIQFHPVNDIIQHVDFFLEINDNNPVSNQCSY
ncbi:MAG: hypothetical protein IPJ26_19610 [Bacteroidetes bacterium]|nr:hypothetical protein [Bacteroidota bacterium]